MGHPDLYRNVRLQFWRELLIWPEARIFSVIHVTEGIREMPMWSHSLSTQSLVRE